MSLESVGIDGDRFRQGQIVGNFVFETRFCGNSNGGHHMTIPSDLESWAIGVKQLWHLPRQSQHSLRPGYHIEDATLIYSRLLFGNEM